MGLATVVSSVCAVRVQNAGSVLRLDRAKGVRRETLSRRAHKRRNGPESDRHCEGFRILEKDNKGTEEKQRDDGGRKTGEGSGESSPVQKCALEIFMSSSVAPLAIGQGSMAGGISVAHFA